MRRAVEALESRLHFSSSLSGLATVRAGAPDPTFGIDGAAPGESWALTNH